MYQIGNVILIVAILLLNVEGGLAGNSTYVDCICLESNSPTPKYNITITNIEMEPAQKNEIANILANNSNSLKNASEAKAKFNEGVVFSIQRDNKSANLSEKKSNNLKAIQSFRDATNLSSEHAEAWYNLGNAYYYNGSFLEALEAYKNSTERFPKGYGENKSWVSFNMGNCCYMLRRFDEAENYYNSAIEKDPKYLDAYNNRALARIEIKKKLTGALDDLNTSLKLLEQMPDKKIEAVRAWNNKGLALSYLERYDDAFSALQNATKIKENPYSYCYEGLIVAQLNQQMLESLIILDKALHLKDYSLSERDEYMVWASKGNVYLKFQDYSNAVSAFRNATSIQHSRGPSWNNASAWIGNGTALMHLNNRNLEALHSFNRALEQNLNKSEAWKGKGDALYKLGCYDDALNAYRKGMDLDEQENKLPVYLDFIVIIIIGVLALFAFSQLAYLIKSKHEIKKSVESPSRSINIWFFPIILALQLCIFLGIMLLFFPKEVFFNYLIASLCILIIVAILWPLFSPHDTKLRTKLKLTLTEFSVTRLGSVWIILILLLFPIVLVICIYFYPKILFDLSRQSLINELGSVIALGLVAFLLPILRIVTSCHVDDDVRKAVIAFHFCWLGLTSLYLSRLIWSLGWNEFAIPMDMGQGFIPNKIPILFAGIFSMFIILFFIPYIYGWRKSKLERQRLLLLQIDILKELSIASQIKGIQQEEKFVYMRKQICDELKILKKTEILQLCKDLIKHSREMSDAFDEECVPKENNKTKNMPNLKKIAERYIPGNIPCMRSDHCCEAKNIDYRFRCFDLLIEVFNSITQTQKNIATTSYIVPIINNTAPTTNWSLVSPGPKSTDPWSENLNILAKHKFEKIQKELDLLMQTKPQIWIAAVSLISPLIVQILGSWMIKLGLSTPPGNLLSSLNQILTGI